MYVRKRSNTAFSNAPACFWDVYLDFQLAFPQP